MRYSLTPRVFLRSSPQVAYILGFILADGCLGRNRFKISNTDAAILGRIREAIGSNHPISSQTRGRFAWHELVVVHRQTVADLETVGLARRKSLTARLPSTPDHLFGHQLRGYFDGDGSARYGLRGGLRVKFTSGSPMLLADISARLATVLAIPPQPVMHDRGRPTACRLYYSGHAAALIGGLMYAAPGALFIARKRRPFDDYRDRTTPHLSHAAAEQIRAALPFRTQREVAAEFGVSPSAISKIARGKSHRDEWARSPAR